MSARVSHRISVIPRGMMDTVDGYGHHPVGFGVFKPQIIGSALTIQSFTMEGQSYDGCTVPTTSYFRGCSTPSLAYPIKRCVRLAR